MLNENYVYYPELITGEELDAFLARGWYRMGQTIFTTHFIVVNEEIHRVYWLRYDLQKIQLSSETKKVMKLNRAFDVRIQPFEMTEEMETLFGLYKTAIDFEAAQSIKFWLHGDLPETNVFDTAVAEVRHNGKLVATGIFDKGKESIAGILNFYHPDYKKYSLGKYLMLLKIEYAIRSGKNYYYPGYIVKNYPRFDYKVFADENAAEIYLPETSDWVSYKKAVRAEIIQPALKS